MATDEAAIRATLQAITAAWREGRIEALEELLRADVVYVAPGFAGRLEGRDACIASYRDFLRVATIDEYAEEDPVIDVFDGSAVATYRFEIDYSMSDERYHETGHDLYILVREDGRWRVAWRTLVTIPVAP